MRRILLILTVLSGLALPFEATALTGDAARFDFSAGVPAIVSNNTSTCNNAATVRYDFSGGVPAQVFDATATCTGNTPTTVSGVTINIDGLLNLGGIILVAH